METKVMLRASYLQDVLSELKFQLAMNIVSIKPHHARNDDLRQSIELIEDLQMSINKCDDIIKDFAVVADFPFQNAHLERQRSMTINEELYFVIRKAGDGMIKGQIYMKLQSDKSAKWRTEKRYETKPMREEEKIIEDVQQWLRSEGVDEQDVQRLPR